MTDLFEEAKQDLKRYTVPFPKLAAMAEWSKHGTGHVVRPIQVIFKNSKKAEFEQRALKYARIKSTVGGTWWME
jgi:hypothetical protein